MLISIITYQRSHIKLTQNSLYPVPKRQSTPPKSMVPAEDPPRNHSQYSHTTHFTSTQHDISPPGYFCSSEKFMVS